MSFFVVSASPSETANAARDARQRSIRLQLKSDCDTVAGVSVMSNGWVTTGAPPMVPLKKVRFVNFDEPARFGNKVPSWVLAAPRAASMRSLYNRTFGFLSRAASMASLKLSFRTSVSSGICGGNSAAGLRAVHRRPATRITPMTLMWILIQSQSLYEQAPVALVYLACPVYWVEPD